MAESEAQAPVSNDTRANLNLTPDEFVFFNRQLASMCRLDIPLADGLLALSKEVSSRNLKSLVTDVQSEVANGTRISNVTKRYRRVFPQLYTGMLEAGEVAGNLPQVLDNLGTYSLSTLRIRKRMQMALIYPILVVVLVSLVMYGLSIFILQNFTDVYEKIGLKNLPWITKALFSFSTFLRNAGWSIPIGLLGVLIGAILLARRKNVRMAFSKIALRIPVLGSVSRFGTYFLFCKTLALLLRAGVPMAASLDLMRQSFAKGILDGVCTEMHKAALNGEKVSDAARKSGLFPETLTWKMAFGEKKGDLASSLDELAVFYEAETQLAAERFQAILGPGVVVCAGLFVAVCYFALFLPILDIQRLLANR